MQRTTQARDLYVWPTPTSHHPIQIILTFNEEVDVQTGASTQHYTINGKPAEASVKVKGKEVILSFTTPIPYGHPELKVSGLRGTNGGVMEEDATRILVLPVPLYPNQYIVSVSASGSQTGNPHTQAVDNDLSTGGARTHRGMDLFRLGKPD